MENVCLEDQNGDVVQDVGAGNVNWVEMAQDHAKQRAFCSQCSTLDFHFKGARDIVY